MMTPRPPKMVKAAITEIKIETMGKRHPFCRHIFADRKGILLAIKQRCICVSENIKLLVFLRVNLHK